VSKRYPTREFLPIVQQNENVVAILGEISLPENWSQRLASAVNNPLGSPPLQEQVYPGDTVAIAVGAGVPEGNELAKAIVLLLKEQGVRHEDIVIVSTAEGLGNERVSELVQESSSTIKPQNDSGQELDNSGASEDPLSVQWVVHDPNSTDSLTMVGVSQEGEPIYVNSLLAKADVVVPIVLMQQLELKETEQGFLYPLLSSTQTQQRLTVNSKIKLRESEEAEQLVSPFFIVGVVPAPGNFIGEILVGTRENVLPHSVEKMRQLWSTRGEAEFATVVATVEGPAASSMENLHRSLVNATLVARQKCPIVMIADAGIHSLSSAAQNADQESVGEADDTGNGSDDAADSDRMSSFQDGKKYPLPASDSGDLLDEDLTEEEREYADAMLWAGFDPNATVVDPSEDESDSMDSESAASSSDSDEEDQEQDDDLDSESLTESRDWDDADEFECTEGEFEFGGSDWYQSLTPAELKSSIRQLLEDLRNTRPVYLVSGLSATATEDLGFGYLSNADELGRLLERGGRVGLLRDAYRWNVR